MPPHSIHGPLYCSSHCHFFISLNIPPLLFIPTRQGGAFQALHIRILQHFPSGQIDTVLILWAPPGPYNPRMRKELQVCVFVYVYYYLCSAP